MRTRQLKAYQDKMTAGDGDRWDFLVAREEGTGGAGYGFRRRLVGIRTSSERRDTRAAFSGSSSNQTHVRGST